MEENSTDLQIPLILTPVAQVIPATINTTVLQINAELW